MPHVTVTLKYTPKPEGDRVITGLHDVSSRNGAVWIESRAPYNCEDSAEALALACALALVAGCADERWRGWHWEAREQDGRLLATTPLGEWYVNREDCEKAVRTLFRSRGTTWQFVSEDGGHESDFLSPRVDDPDCYEQLEDVPAGVTHVRSRRGVVATLHEDDGRWRGDRGQVIPLDAGGPWFSFVPNDAQTIAAAITNDDDEYDYLAADDTPEVGQ